MTEDEFRGFVESTAQFRDAMREAARKVERVGRDMRELGERLQKRTRGE